MHYLWCLNQVVKVNSSAKQFLIFQDDIELDETRFFSVLKKFVNQLEIQKDYALKFYHPARLLGFIQPELSRICEFLAFGVVFYYLLKIIINNRFILTRKQTKSWFFIISLFIFSINIILLINGMVQEGIIHSFIQ